MRWCAELLIDVKTLRIFLILLTALGVTGALFGLLQIKWLNAEKELVHIDDAENVTLAFNVRNGEYGACGFKDASNQTPRYSSTEKHIVLRSVYWDPRSFKSLKNGFWVFLAVAEKNIVSKNLTIGVQLDNNSYYVLDVETPLQDYIDYACPNLTHEFIVVRCNASLSTPRYAAILYKMEPNGEILSAVSEKPAIVNIMPKRSNKVKKIVSCLAMAYGELALLPHWIRYQRTIGVSHVHVIADQSFVESGALNNSVVERALESDFLSVTIWPKWFSSWQVYYHEQVLAYQDCVHRFLGHYDYVFPHDADDFFVPLGPEKKLIYYVEKYCPRGTCSFHWEQITPPISGLTAMIGNDGNVTDKVPGKHSRKKRSEGKSLHNLEDTFEIIIHSVSKSAIWNPTTVVPHTAAYVAHIRY